MHHQVHRTTTTFALVFAVITFLSIASTASALVTTFTPTMQEATVAATGSAATATTATVSRQPTYYISHGGGPCFFLKPQDQMSPDMGPDGPMAEALKGLLTSLKTKPDAILIISAHWESKGKAVSVTTQEKPGLLFDYYGFPKYTYDLKWPAPGNPKLAKQVQELLKAKGIACDGDAKRDFDHGVFVPMLLAAPKADIPTVVLSLRGDLDPQFHIDIGKALAPLRSQNVLIIGSGSSAHGFFGRASTTEKKRGAKLFDDWLADTMNPAKHSAEEREKLLVAWSKAPGANLAHPREEHLMPLHVAAGAADGDDAVKFFDKPSFGGFAFSMFRFGSL